MPDSKITALASTGTGTDPANDPLVIVDVSDTSMAASGTTKKVTLNNLLACSPTATLASATITGDLTAARWFVSGGSLPGVSNSNPFAYRIGGGGLGIGAATETGTTAPIVFYCGAGGVEQYRIAPLGVFTWSDGAGGTRMTLNSTGLGVGVTPASGDGSGVFKAAGTGALTANSRAGLDVRELVSGNQAGIILGAMTTENTAVIGSRTASGNIAFQTYNGSSWGERMRIDYLGNVGVGVAPSAWNASFRGIDISTGGAIAGSSDSVRLFSNSAFNTAGNNVYKNAATAGRYDIQGNVHTWSISTNAPSAGGTITFSPAMTLDASGNLLVGTASGSFRGQFAVASGADRNIFTAQVTGASNGLQVLWNHATTTLRIVVANLPTSSAGLATGTLWIDTAAGNTLKVA